MIDWARAELLYRQGDFSIREIARREGVSEGAVRKRAKARGWQRERASPVQSGTNSHPRSRNKLSFKHKQSKRGSTELGHD
jgi:uncharacterized protein YjcR